MKRLEKVFNKLLELCIEQYKKTGKLTGVPTNNIADILNIHRANVSADLNKLCQDGKADKVKGKPVLYKIKKSAIWEPASQTCKLDEFANIIGANMSLENAVSKAKMAIMYPPRGLHVLLHGETGTGKSMFAETMYRYAKETKRVKKDSLFVTFNCADYSYNPQLLMAHMFGVKKGSYTGAYEDRIGLVKKADGGILFLDEIHRLPPEGQEMFFYLIDKGLYRKLGETGAYSRANLLIVGATTENANSVLLKTFIRRIPVIINLPPLEKRTQEERFELVCHFVRMETANISSDIMVTGNALRAFMLYGCPYNVGQLKSDIKLSCAKAFLENEVKKGENIIIRSSCLPEHVKYGLLKYKENRKEIDQFVTEHLMIFSGDKKNTKIEKSKKIPDFHEGIEVEIQTLKLNDSDKGMADSTISFDIETYFKKHIFNMEQINLEELYKVADKEIVSIVNSFVRYACDQLNKKIPLRILYALSIHLSAAIERILKGEPIENLCLNELKTIYEKEFDVAKNLKLRVKQVLNIDLPETEVGFITMFLTFDELKSDDSRVAVIVVMHGKSAATSIAEVANKLLGEELAIAYNMPLEQKPDKALADLIEIAKSINKGRGIVMLVDMGSLVFFGDVIHEKTGIPVKTMEMVSTPMVLEAARKAMMKASLDEVYNAAINAGRYIGKVYGSSFAINRDRKNVVVVACITGRGTAVKLESMLEQRYSLQKNGIEAVLIDASSKIELKQKIDKIKLHKNILAVISAFSFEDNSILHVSTSDSFTKEKAAELSNKVAAIKNMNTIYNMSAIIKKNIDIDVLKYMNSFQKLYLKLLSKGILLNDDTVLGLVLHLACTVENRLKNKKTTHITIDTEKIINKNLEKFELIKEAVAVVEGDFVLKFSDVDYVNIMRIVFP